MSSNGPTLDELISRRDELKININSDQRRAELSTVVGAITTILHEPFKVEADRLREKRQEITGGLAQAQHERTQLRNALGHAGGARTTALGRGVDGQLVALIEREADSIRSGVSAA